MKKIETMRTLIIILSALALPLAAGAQGEATTVEGGIPAVLRLVGENNKTIQAGAADAEALKLQARSENNLANPEASYSHLWGNKEGMGYTGEFILSQAFDFPTLYYQRGRQNRVRAASIDAGQQGVRQQVLLQAELACMDLVYLNQMRSLLSRRLADAEELRRFYAQRLEEGDANIIETNKIELELLNARNRYRQNEIAREAKLRELAALNGGEAIAFEDTTYTMSYTLPHDFDAFRLEAFDALPELETLRQAQAAAERQVKISRQQWLPGLTLGYRMNPSSGGDRYNGIIAGISIPLFANRHKVKQAKAERFAAETRLQSVEASTEANLQQLYARASEAKRTADEFADALRSQDNLRLLQKAIRAGQLSMVEYFVNLTTLYDSMESLLQLRNEEQKALAELYRHELR